MLASGAEDGKFVLWDMIDGWATRATPAHNQKSKTRYSRRTGILDLAFTKDGQLITVGRDRNLLWWNPDGTSAGRIQISPHYLCKLHLDLMVRLYSPETWLAT